MTFGKGTLFKASVQRNFAESYSIARPLSLAKMPYEVDDTLLSEIGPLLVKFTASYEQDEKLPLFGMDVGNISKIHYALVELTI